jgi:hypothetical protein
VRRLFRRRPVAAATWRTGARAIRRKGTFFGSHASGRSGFDPAFLVTPFRCSETPKIRSFPGRGPTGTDLRNLLTRPCATSIVSGGRGISAWAGAPSYPLRFGSVYREQAISASATRPNRERSKLANTFRIAKVLCAPRVMQIFVQLPRLFYFFLSRSRDALGVRSVRCGPSGSAHLREQLLPYRISEDASEGFDSRFLVARNESGSTELFLSCFSVSMSLSLCAAWHAISAHRKSCALALVMREPSRKAPLCAAM